MDGSVCVSTSKTPNRVAGERFPQIANQTLLLDLGAPTVHHQERRTKSLKKEDTGSGSLNCWQRQLKQTLLVEEHDSQKKERKAMEPSTNQQCRVPQELMSPSFVCLFFY